MSVPALRFKDNNGESFPIWESKAIGDVLSIGSGKDYKHLSLGLIPVYGTGGYMLSVDSYLHDGESVCIGRKGTIDKPTLLNGKFWTVDTLFYTHSFKGCLPKFIYACFQRIDWKNYNEASGVPSLSKSTIEKIDIQIPSVPEQTKIANFLTAIDEKITQLMQKHELLTQYKKGVMHQIFNQELRFKDDDGQDFPEWVEKPLNKLIYEPEKHKVLNAKSIELLTVKLHFKGVIRSGKYPLATEKGRPYYVRETGELIIGRQNLHNGGVAIVTEETQGCIASNAISSFRTKENVSVDFIYLSMTMPFFINAVDTAVGGTGQKEVSTKQLLNITILMPCEREQLRIATFIASIDNKLTHTQNQLAAAKQYKQGLLQQMFV